MNILYTCNNGYFDGLYLSILSIVRRNKQHINFYIVSADFTELNKNFKNISKKNKKSLSNLVKKYNHKIKFIDGKKYYDKYLKGNKNENSKYSPYSMFRILCDKIKELPDKILYLDCDVMANKSIKSLYNIDISNYDFAINHDWLSKYWKMFRPNYINSGVILLNIKNIKKSYLMEKCRNLLFTKKFMLPDQTVLYKCANNFKFFPDGYKYNNQSGKINSDTVLMHFCARLKGWPKNHNIKSWEIDKIHKILKIHNFDKDFEIFLKEKNKKY